MGWFMAEVNKTVQVEKKAGLETGMVMAIAEVRGVVKDHIAWVDKSNGTRKEADIIKLQAELMPLSGSPVQCSVTMEEKTASDSAALLVKGTLVLLSLTGLTRQMGAWSAKADRLEAYMR